MKYKNCSVELVGNTKEDILQMIQKYKDCIFFKHITHSNIRKVTFDTMFGFDLSTDWRTKVCFISKASKNNIIYSVNGIKPNPIKFLSPTYKY
jgi:D-mannonate dehydratase